MGDISEDILIPNLEKLLSHYSENNRPTYTYKKIKDIIGLPDTEFEAFAKQLEAHKLITKTLSSTDLCDSCGKPARIIDPQKGICSCDYGHKTIRQPLSLVRAKIDEKAVLYLLHERLFKSLSNMSEPDSSESKAFSLCGYEIIGQTKISDMNADFLFTLKKTDVKDAVTLLGLLNNSKSDIFLVFVPKVDQNGTELLAFRANGAIQQLPFNLLLNDSRNIAVVMKRLSEGLTSKAIHISSWLRFKLQAVPSIASPDVFNKMMQYNAKLVDDSYKAATHGMQNEFEDCGANLFSSFIPTSQLGYTNKAVAKKIEKPDGVILVEDEDKKLKLMFYDCKSVGTESKASEIKEISQADEDEFVRYAKIFSDESIPAKLAAGCFVANDFSETNMMNKILQLRKRVPNETRIVFLPLRSLVHLYSRVTSERQAFSMRFRPSNHFDKFLGIALAKKESTLLEKDASFSTYSKIKSLDVNAVYVIPSLVDVFMNDVLNSVALEARYLPFFVEKSARLSVRA